MPVIEGRGVSDGSGTFVSSCSANVGVAVDSAVAPLSDSVWVGLATLFANAFEARTEGVDGGVHVGVRVGASVGVMLGVRN